MCKVHMQARLHQRDVCQFVQYKLGLESVIRALLIEILNQNLENFSIQLFENIALIMMSFLLSEKINLKAQMPGSVTNSINDVQIRDCQKSSSTTYDILKTEYHVVGWTLDIQNEHTSLVGVCYKHPSSTKEVSIEHISTSPEVFHYFKQP